MNESKNKRNELKEWMKVRKKGMKGKWMKNEINNLKEWTQVRMKGMEE